MRASVPSQREEMRSPGRRSVSSAPCQSMVARASVVAPALLSRLACSTNLPWSPAFRACFSTMWRAEALACSANLRCSSTSDLPVPSVLTGPRACRRPCWFLRLGGSCCSTAKVMRRYGASLFHSSPVRTSGWICAPTILMAACVNTCGRSGHAAMPSSFSGAMSGFCWLPEPGRSG